MMRRSNLLQVLIRGGSAPHRGGAVGGWGVNQKPAPGRVATCNNSSSLRRRMKNASLVVVLAVAASASALELGRSLIQRPALASYLRSKAQPGVTVPEVRWLEGGPGAPLQRQFWVELCRLRPGGGPVVLALPGLDARRAAAMASFLDLPPLPGLHGALRMLPLAGAPTPCLLVERRASSAADVDDDGSGRGGRNDGFDEAAAVRRTRAWVRRALARGGGGLGLCPYTVSDDLAATGLEANGIAPAPILHGASAASDLPRLLADFWVAVEAMVGGGEERWSSILLAAPAWDGRWDAWCRDVFPLLEWSLLSSGLSRTLGIVCCRPTHRALPHAVHLPSVHC